jgi:hypothetical protein
MNERPSFRLVCKGCGSPTIKIREPRSTCPQPLSTAGPATPCVERWPPTIANVLLDQALAEIDPSRFETSWTAQSSVDQWCRLSISSPATRTGCSGRP